MTPIPDTYTKHGFTFKLIARKGMRAVYEQWKHGRLWAYEVVKIRQLPDRERSGRMVPAQERLPSDEDFGAYGKTYSVAGGRHQSARKAAYGSPTA